MYNINPKCVLSYLRLHIRPTLQNLSNDTDNTAYAFVLPSPLWLFCSFDRRQTLLNTCKGFLLIFRNLCDVFFRSLFNFWQVFQFALLWEIVSHSDGNQLAIRPPSQTVCLGCTTEEGFLYTNMCIWSWAQQWTFPLNVWFLPSVIFTG